MRDCSLTLPDYTIVDARTPDEIERADLSAFRRSLRRSRVHTRENSYLRIAVADLEGVRLASVESGSHSVTLIEPYFVALLRPVQGEASVLRGRQPTTVEPGSSILLDAGERTTSVGPGYQGLQALLPRKSLAAALRAMTQENVAPELGDLVLDRSSPACAHLDNFLLAMVRSLGAPDRGRAGSRWADIAASQALLALVAGAAMEQGPPAVGEAARPCAPWKVRRAEELLRARAREPITIADVCRELQVGARALQLAFRRYRETTPKRFLEECRLDLAREQLRDGDERGSVTSAALDCGFTHVGRFAAAYRARFGELPHATLRSGR
jgi:AraC-like DNA-binding protein